MKQIVTRTIAGVREINLSDFYEHFKNLSSEMTNEEDFEIEELLRKHDENVTQSTFPELDAPFTCDEIRNGIKLFDRNKAVLFDHIMYEYLIEGAAILDKPLETLFNSILEKEKFPISWSKGVIIPVYKKGV